MANETSGQSQTTTISPRMARCLRHYEQPFPRPPSCTGDGWGTATLDEALNRDFLHVGPHGAHDLTDLGREALNYVRR